MSGSPLKQKLASPVLRKIGVVVSVLALAGGAGFAGLRYGQKSAAPKAVAHGDGHGDGRAKEHGDEHAKSEPIREPASEHGKGHPAKHGDVHAKADPHEESAEDAAHEAAHKEAVAAKHGDADPPHGLVGKYVKAYKDVQARVAELRRADEDNERLRLENAHLRLKVESMQFNCHASDAAKSSQEFQIKLDRETGTKMGRTLASISYQMPTHLNPEQLYTLGVSYFAGREDEKAAVIFTFLTGQAGDDRFKTAKNLVLTGVAWYRLDNLAAADSYFDQALQSTDMRDAPGLQAQARVWKALVAQRQGKRRAAQEMLTDVMNLNPHSTEAKWINSREVNRAVASH